MIEVVGIVFAKDSRLVYCEPGELELTKGDWCVVATEFGEDIAEVVEDTRVMKDDERPEPLFKVLRKPTTFDLERVKKNREKEKKAREICIKRIEEQRLPMRLADVHLSLDQNKYTFYFTADQRVDFRELVKELNSEFETKIELCQIGARDGAKLFGGFSWCGRELCCATFLKELRPVTTKMAKEQNLSLSVSKITGVCGRLICCLEYEYEVYKEFRKRAPKEGAHYEIEGEKGVVESIDPVNSCIRVRLKDDRQIEVQI
jgi:cell fate regulator YaaT (PSP1 superfamily)